MGSQGNKGNGGNGEGNNVNHEGNEGNGEDNKGNEGSEGNGEGNEGNGEGNKANEKGYMNDNKGNGGNGGNRGNKGNGSKKYNSAPLSSYLKPAASGFFATPTGSTKNQLTLLSICPHKPSEGKKVCLHKKVKKSFEQGLNPNLQLLSLLLCP